MAGPKISTPSTVEADPVATGSARIATTDGSKDIPAGESATTRGSVDHAAQERGFKKSTVEGGSGSGGGPKSGPAEAAHKGAKIPG